MHSKFEIIKRNFRRKRYAYTLVAPMVIAMVVLILYPIARVVWMSFCDYYLAHPASHTFIGLQNYKAVINAFEFNNAVRVTGIYLVVTVPVRFVLGLIIALLMNKPFRGQTVARSMLILPWALPVVIASLVWVWLFNIDYGIINHLLLRFNLIEKPLGFLSSMDLALPSVILVNIWKGTSFIAFMLLAGLQSIPNDLYEAAEIDGASKWQQFYSITMPMLKPVSNFLLVLLFICTIREFELVYVMTSGGPARATELFNIFLYKTAFTNMQFGQASAGGVMLLLLSLALTIIFLKFYGEEEESATW